MKNIKSKILLFAFFAFSTISCSTYKEVSYKYNTAPIYNLEEGQVTNGKLETDLEMIGEVTASYTISNNRISYNNRNLQEGTYVVDDDFLLKFKSEKTTQLYKEAKATVLHMALEKAGCDMILAPIYKLEVKGEGLYNSNGRFISFDSYNATYTISVKGFGANIKGVRQIKTN